MKKCNQRQGAHGSAVTCFMAQVLGGLLGAVGACQAYPANLQPGDVYRLAFVTAGTIMADSSDISVYDAFVNSSANDAGSIIASYGASDWRAIVSTLTVDAYDHIGGNFVAPVYSLDGHLVAANAADLWDGGISYPIFEDQFGSSFARNVNTGTDLLGHATDSPLGGGVVPNGLGYISGGAAGYTNYNWMVGSHEGFSSRPIYGISGLLVVPGGGTDPGPGVPLPEPPVWALLALGLAAALGVRHSTAGA